MLNPILTNPLLSQSPKSTSIKSNYLQVCGKCFRLRQTKSQTNAKLSDSPYICVGSVNWAWTDISMQHATFIAGGRSHGRH